MPSPIAHSATGYVIYRILRPRLGGQASRKIGPLSLSLAVALGLSLIPDLDSVFGIVVGDLRQYHNNLTHNLILGFIVALSIGGMAWLKQRSGFVSWFTLSLLCYDMHVIMDYFTIGRGVMLFWPFSSSRYSSPVTLFYGVRWSEGWISFRHLWTIGTELIFVVVILILVHRLSVSKRSRTF
jgi:membrane-bound metal-dependent hydrolase YbcI (DUF457 family)